MKKPTLLLGIGIAIGASIGNSADALIIGIVIALFPWIVIGLAHSGVTIHRKMWIEVEHAKRLRPLPFRPAELDSFEYQRYYDTGELPERWEKYYEHHPKLRMGGRV